MIVDRKSVLFMLSLLIIVYLSGNAAAIFSYPTVTTLPAVSITSTSAILGGEVNPNGIDTQVFFSSADPVTSPSHFGSTPPENIGSGTSPVLVNYTLTGLQPGTTYNFTVSASNSMGGDIGTTLSFTTSINPPSAPQNLIATAGASSISLNWNTPGNNGGSAITGYKIYRGSTAGGETSLTTASNLAFTDTSITGGQTYYYKVSAINAAGEGAQSNEASATVPAVATLATTTTTTVPPTTTLPLTVTISSKPESIQIGQTSRIIVNVRSDSETIAGANVMLSATNGSKVNPTSGKTDSSGQFSSNLNGSTAGKVTVMAIVNKEGFEDGKREIQIAVSVASTQPETPKLASITGRILNVKTGDPIQGVTISVDGKPATTTGPDGMYELKVNTGNYTNFSVAKQGFEAISQAVTVIPEGTIVSLSLTPVSEESSWWWIVPVLIVILIAIGIGSLLWIRGKMQLIPKIISVPADGKSNIPIKIQFTNIFGKLRKQNKDREVEMETTAGAIKNVAIPSGKEYIEAMLTSSKECGPVTITAKSGKQKATAQVEFTCNEAGLDVEISPATIPANGKSTATVILKIKGADGNYLTFLNERTIELTTTLGTIMNTVRFPPKTLAAVGVITSSPIAGTAKVLASSCMKESKPIVGEGKVVFGELEKRYCMHCGFNMPKDAPSCPSCGRIPPSGSDTKQCSTCNMVLPQSAKYCDKCGAKQPM